MTESPVSMTAPSPVSLKTRKSQESFEDILTSMDLVDREAESENSSVSNSSRFSRSSSALSYYKRTFKQGLDALMHLYAAVSSTGFPMSKVEFAKAMSMMQTYNDYYPTPKTHDVVTNDETLRVAAYFINFTMPSYGAALLNYFGYGKLTDIFKVNQNLKATLQHLKLEKKHMLAWEYESHGIFSHKPCFYIVFDKHTKSIIVSIRGTFVRLC
jgi:hypothetical protein